MTKFLLSGDPGVKNFGVVIWNIATGECLLATKLRHTVHDLKDDVQEQINNFLNEIDDLLEKAGFEEGDEVVLALERFISRGMRSSSTPELIPLMIGALATKADSTQLYIAATWKGYVNRALKVRGATLDISAKTKADYAARGITRSLYKMWGRSLGGGAHILDAALIGRHALCELADFPRLETTSDFKQLYKDVLDALYLPRKKGR